MTIREILANWNSVAFPAQCKYCQDFSPCHVIPFQKGHEACQKCFRAICYGM